jgi:SAM-dependent methyltransferase
METNMTMPAYDEATYYPGVFNVPSMEQARNVILTTEFDQSSKERWIRETPYLTDLILSKVKLDAGERFVLDYGCGIGRISKELISKSNCTAIGVDISSSMRGFAAHHVDDDSFFACSPKSFDMIRKHMKFDLAVVVWVLQHCLDPEEDLRTIRDSLFPGAKMFVVNNVTRVVPTLERGWANDGIDIQKLIKDVGFEELEIGSLDPEVVPRALSEATFWGLYVWR